MITLSSAIRYHARRTPTAPAVLYGGKTIDYATLFDRIARLGGWLSAQGIVAGDVVAVVMKNSAAFIEIAFATSHIGAIFLPINFRLSAKEIAYILDNAGAKHVLIDDELADRGGGSVPVTLIDRDAQHDMSTLARQAAPAPMADGLTTADIFRLMYTSGTTDHPKGVVHSYENFHFKCIDHIATLNLTAATRLLVAGPLYHVGAFDLPGVAVLLQGGLIAILRDFDPDAVLATIAREQLNAAWLAPVMTSALLSHEGRHRYDVSSLHWVIGGGERTPESRIHAFTDVFSNARYIDAYGLTESCSGDSFMEPGRELEKIGSTGRATAHVDISIRDDRNLALPPGVEGEICLRGPKIFKSYWRDPVKTAEAFADGWFRTGDIGFLDDEGFLYVTDRKKDMIISGGENIASSEVERVIQLLPQVAEVAVIGLPDKRWGEVPAAVVVLKPDSALDLSALDTHCRAYLASFKAPKRLILRDILPRNPSGKVLKRALRDELQ